MAKAISSGDSLRAVRSRIEASPAGKVKIAITDTDGILRGKYINKEKFRSALDGGLGFCSVVFGWDSADACYDEDGYAGWSSGYPDAHARLDLATYREVPWDRDVPFLLGEFVDEAGGPLPICPRQVLKRVLARAERAGLTALTSLEYEFFHFRETPQSLAAKGFAEPEALSPGMFGY